MEMFKSKLFIVRLMLFKQLLVKKVLKYVHKPGSGRAHPQSQHSKSSWSAWFTKRVPGLTPQLLRNPVSKTNKKPKTNKQKQNLHRLKISIYM